MKKFVFSLLLLSPIVVRSCPDDLVKYTVDNTHLPLVKRIVAHGSARLNAQEPPVYVTDSLASTDILRKPSCIFISENFNNGSYPLKKIALLSTVYNGRQRNDEKHNFHKVLPGSRTIEQEAHTQAILCANCPACVHDFSCSHMHTSARNLTAQELADLTKQLKDAPLCPYHRAIVNRFTYRLVNWIYFLGSKVYPKNRITDENINAMIRSKNEKRYIKAIFDCVWMTVTSIPEAINKSFFEYANRWIGRDVEEKIAKGELEV